MTPHIRLFLSRPTETTSKLTVSTRCKQEQVQHALEHKNKEGCQIKGHVAVPLADGNLHFAPSRDIEHANLPWENVLSFTFEVRYCCSELIVLQLWVRLSEGSGASLPFAAWHCTICESTRALDRRITT